MTTRTAYAAGFNEPGFMPNPDSVHDFDTPNEAWLYLVGEIEADQADLAPFSNYAADSLERAILDFDPAPLKARTAPGEVHLAGLVFWVNKFDTSDTI